MHHFLLENYRQDQSGRNLNVLRLTLNIKKTVVLNYLMTNSSCPLLFSSTLEVIPEPPEPVTRESDTNNPADGEENEVKPSKSGAPENAEIVEAESVKGTHELLVCTEEQVRVIALPSLKTKHKYRFGEKTSTSLLSSGLIHRPRNEKPCSDTIAPTNHTPVENNATPQEIAETKVGFAFSQKLDLLYFSLSCLFRFVFAGNRRYGIYSTSCNSRG